MPTLFYIHPPSRQTGMIGAFDVNLTALSLLALVFGMFTALRLSVALAAPFCADDGAAEYRLGFAYLHETLGADVMGVPLECEHRDAAQEQEPVQRELGSGPQRDSYRFSFEVRLCRPESWTFFKMRSTSICSLRCSCACFCHCEALNLIFS